MEIQKKLQEEVIEPADIERASSIVFVLKKDGSLKFGVNYCKLNMLTVRDAYPLPRTNECIDSLGRARIFTILAARSGFRYIEIDKHDI